MSFTVNIQSNITSYIYYILIHLYINIVTTSRRLGVLIEWLPNTCIIMFFLLNQSGKGLFLSLV